jgi:ribosomal protein S27E
MRLPNLEDDEAEGVWVARVDPPSEGWDARVPCVDCERVGIPYSEEGTETDYWYDADDEEHEYVTHYLNPRCRHCRHIHMLDPDLKVRAGL